jgi:hypothetical protein
MSDTDPTRPIPPGDEPPADDGRGGPGWLRWQYLVPVALILLIAAGIAVALSGDDDSGEEDVATEEETSTTEEETTTSTAEESTTTSTTAGPTTTSADAGGSTTIINITIPTAPERPGLPPEPEIPGEDDPSLDDIAEACLDRDGPIGEAACAYLADLLAEDQIQVITDACQDGNQRACDLLERLFGADDAYEPGGEGYPDSGEEGEQPDN